MNITRKKARDLIILKLKPMIRNTPESSLMFAIFAQALDDYYQSFPRVPSPPKQPSPVTAKEYQRRLTAYNSIIHLMRDGLDYLNGPMVHLSASGVNPDYARRIMREIHGKLKISDQTIPPEIPRSMFTANEK